MDKTVDMRIDLCIFSQPRVGKAVDNCAIPVDNSAPAVDEPDFRTIRPGSVDANAVVQHADAGLLMFGIAGSCNPGLRARRESLKRIIQQIDQRLFSYSR